VKHSAPLLLLVVLQVGGLALAAIGAVTEDEAAQIALQTVKRAAGSAARITERDLGQRSWTFTVDDRWWVGVVPATGSVPIMADLDLRESEDPEGALDAPLSSTEIEAAALELLRKVFPGFDMAEFVLKSAKPVGQRARVSAYWRRIIPGCGFPGPGQCHVEFRWSDRAIAEIGAECPPIPDEWRRPATVTAERAEAIGKAALGDLQGGWLETTKDLCVWDEPNPPRPAWNVLLRSGPRDKPEECMSIRSVFVDPWTGEIVHTTTWKSAAAGPAEPQAKPNGTATMPTAQPPTDAEAERSAHGRWLFAAGAAVLAIALGAAMVCVRRRRS